MILPCTAVGFRALYFPFVRNLFRECGHLVMHCVVMSLMLTAGTIWARGEWMGITRNKRRAKESIMEIENGLKMEYERMKRCQGGTKRVRLDAKPFDGQRSTYFFRKFLKNCGGSKCS